MKTWVLIANASIAFLYSTKNLHTDDLQLIEAFYQEESRLKTEALISDRQGSYQIHGRQGSAYEKSDPKEQIAHNFAHHLSKILINKKEQFNELIIVAAPHFYGLMDKHLKSIGHAIHINKDYTHLKGRELLETLRDSIYT